MTRRTQHQQRCGHGLGNGVGCKHNMSAHRYGHTSYPGPQSCGVPGCHCPLYVDPRTASFAVYEDGGSHFRDYKKLAEAEHAAKVCSKDSYLATVRVHAAARDTDGQIVVEYCDGKKVR